MIGTFLCWVINLNKWFIAVTVFSSKMQLLHLGTPKGKKSESVFHSNWINLFLLHNKNMKKKMYTEVSMRYTCTKIFSPSVTTAVSMLYCQILYFLQWSFALGRKMTEETLCNNICRKTGNIDKKHYKRANRISLGKKKKGWKSLQNPQEF